VLRVPKPTIGMVHGYCIYGAFGHASSLDILFASEDALFLGAGLGRAVWDMGLRKLLEITYENRFITAQEAYKYHLVNRLFPDHATLERETLAYAARVANETAENLHNAKRAYLRMLDSQGYTRNWDAFAQPWKDGWARQARAGHPMRYEGRGMARTPVAYYNLAMKFLSEGEEVPERIIEALQRALVRDDRGAWQRALHQEGREPERIAHADASAQAWQERMQREGIKDIKERIADLLEEQGWGIPATAQP
jgi:enoyl-CoA hydratase/carnithine racemase